MTEFDVGDQVRARARFLINNTQLQTRADAGDLTISLYSVSGLANADVLLINPGVATQESRTIASISGLVVTLTAVLSFDHEAGETVGEVVDPCLG